jgi:hypothetical protein
MTGIDSAQYLRRSRMLKRIFLCLALLAFAQLATAEASSLNGSWHGTLSTEVGSLRLILTIEEASGNYTASIVSVDQGGAVIPVDIKVDGESLQFTNAQFDIDYQAEVDGPEMVGTFTQFGNEIPGLKLVRK